MMKLSRLWARIRNVPGLFRDLVALATLIALGLGSAGYLLANYDWTPPWEHRVVFAAELDKAPGIALNALQEVRIAGVKVGKVTSAKPLKNGNARIEMSLEEGHTVYQNAHVVWRSKAPVNVMYVSLDPGGLPAKPLPKGDTIPVSQTERAIQPFELLDKLDKRTRSALTTLVNQMDVTLANAPAELPHGLRATSKAVSSFQPVVDQLQKRRQSIKELVTALSRISTAAGKDHGRLVRLTSSLQETLGVLSKRDDALKATLHELPGFSQDLNTAMKNTSTLTDQLDPTLKGLQKASDELPAAIRRLSQTMERALPVIKKASPVVQKAKPVVADLRPLVSDVDATLTDLSPVTGNLPQATKRLVPWLQNLQAFVYQTSSAFSLADVNGGLGRANVTVDVTAPLGWGVGSTPPDGNSLDKEGN